MIKRIIPLIALVVLFPSCGYSSSNHAKSTSTTTGIVDKNSKTNSAVEYVMPSTEYPEFPFMSNYSTGDNILDNSIKQYQMFSIDGEVQKELFFT